VSLIFAKYYRILRLILIAGLARWTQRILDWGTLNNWTSDKYNWGREVVVVTGGSNGIGALVVQGLATKGIRVVVLDAQPLSYQTG
jgi:all-trans-retinol dehydrogenase (NAD+)